MLICSWKKFRDKRLIPLIEEHIENTVRDLICTFEDKADAKATFETKENAETLKCRVTAVERSLAAIRRDLDRASKEQSSVDLDRAVQIQSERCKIYQADYETDDVYNEKVNGIASIFKNPVLQETLDAFDFEQAADTANKLGYTVGLNERKIEVNELIRDAIEMFDGLEKEVEDGKCGRKQLGRLVATKMWSEETEEPWYMLNYFIEMTER